MALVVAGFLLIRIPALGGGFILEHRQGLLNPRIDGAIDSINRSSTLLSAQALAPAVATLLQGSHRRQAAQQHSRNRPTAKHDHPS